MTLRVERVRHRAGADGEDLQARLSRVRGADHVRRPRVRRRQEDHLARRHRRALGAAQVPVHRVTHPLKRLFGYADAVPRRARRGRRRRCSCTPSASAGLAALIKPIFDNVAAEPGEPRAHGLGDRRRLPAQGRRLVRVVVPDGRRRAARRDGPAQRALPAHPRPVGRLLRAADDRAADVAHQQRRRPGAAGRCRRRSAISRASRSRWSATRRCCSTRRAADDRLHDRRAAHRVSARSGSASACGGRRGAARRRSSSCRTSAPRRSPAIAS